MTWMWVRAEAFKQMHASRKNIGREINPDAEIPHESE